MVQPSNEQLHSLVIEKVRFLNNHLVRIAIGDNQQSVFQVSLIFPVTTSVSQTVWKIAALMFLHAGFMTLKFPLSTRLLWI